MIKGELKNIWKWAYTLLNWFQIVMFENETKLYVKSIPRFWKGSNIVWNNQFWFSFPCDVFLSFAQKIISVQVMYSDDSPPNQKKIGVKPSAEPMLYLSRTGTLRTLLYENGIKMKLFSFTKMYLKCPLQNRRFAVASMGVNTLRRTQNGRHFADGISKFIFMCENC